MRPYKIFLLLIALSIRLGGLGACTKARQDDQATPIRIAVYESLTGNNAGGGQESLAGIEMAYATKSEVLGRKVELVRADLASDPLAAGKLAKDLVDQKVNLVIGSASSALSIAGAPTFAAAKIPVIITGSTSPLVTQASAYHFRLCFTDHIQGQAMASFVSDSLGISRAAIIKDMSSEYSVSLCQAFQQSFQSMHGAGSVILQESYIGGGNPNFKDIIKKLQVKHPEVVFAGGEYKDCVRLVQALREAGYNGPILGGDTWDIEAFLDGVGMTNDLYFTANFHPANASSEPGRLFLAACDKAAKEASSLTALGYDAYLLALDAIERAGSTDPQAIRNALAATKDFPGATGPISFDDKGDATKPVVIDALHNGEVQFVTLIRKKAVPTYRPQK